MVCCACGVLLLLSLRSLPCFRTVLCSRRLCFKPPFMRNLLSLTLRQGFPALHAATDPSFLESLSCATDHLAPAVVASLVCRCVPYYFILRWFTLAMYIVIFRRLSHPTRCVCPESNLSNSQPEYPSLRTHSISFVVCFGRLVTRCVPPSGQAGMQRRKTGRGAMEEARRATAPMAPANGGRGGGGRAERRRLLLWRGSRRRLRWRRRRRQQGATVPAFKGEMDGVGSDGSLSEVDAAAEAAAAFPRRAARDCGGRVGVGGSHWWRWRRQICRWWR